MKFIEIVSPTASREDALSRALVECKDLAGAERKAMPLLEIWTRHGATHARILNLDGTVAAEGTTSYDIFHFPFLRVHRLSPGTLHQPIC